MATFEAAFQEAKDVLGGISKIAKVCGVTYRAVLRWEEKGCLPRTEYSGETDYAWAIERATNSKVKRWDLLPRLTKPGSGQRDGA